MTPFLMLTSTLGEFVCARVYRGLQPIQGQIDLFPERNAEKPIEHGLVEVFETTIGISCYGKRI